MKTRLDEKGMSLVAVVVAAGIMSITTLAMVGQMNLVSQMMKKQGIVDAIEVMRSQVKNTLLNETAWDETINAEANEDQLTCLLNDSTSCSSAAGTINLLDAEGRVIVNSKTPSSGLTRTGEVCGNFPTGDEEPNDSCPIKMTLEWEPLCGKNNPTCVDPLVSVKGTFSYNGQPVVGGLNLERFELQVIREHIFQNPEDIINDNLGSIETCPQNQLFIGFDNQGNKVCRADLGKKIADQGSCPKGQLLAGFNRNGTKICKTAASNTTVNRPTTGCPACRGASSSAKKSCETRYSPARTVPCGRRTANHCYPQRVPARTISTGKRYTCICGTWRCI